MKKHGTNPVLLLSNQICCILDHLPRHLHQRARTAESLRPSPSICESSSRRGSPSSRSTQVRCGYSGISFYLLMVFIAKRFMIAGGCVTQRPGAAVVRASARLTSLTRPPMPWSISSRSGMGSHQTRASTFLQPQHQALTSHRRRQS